MMNELYDNSLISDSAINVKPIKFKRGWQKCILEIVTRHRIAQVIETFQCKHTDRVPHYCNMTLTQFNGKFKSNKNQIIYNLS